jgi:DNA-binding XRE family transcriptional regulator
MADTIVEDDKAEAHDTSYHDHRLARRLAEDPEFAAEFERQKRAIQAIDAIVNTLDDLRGEHGMTKSALAEMIGKNPASIRRLLTAPVNPELRTVVAMADALDADVLVVPRKRSGRRSRALRPPS